MAYYSFANPISEGAFINVVNFGIMNSEFTYEGDVIEGVSKLIKLKQMSQSNETINVNASFRVLYIGNNKPVPLRYFTEAIEKSVGRTTIKNLLPLQEGVVSVTSADIEPLTVRRGVNPTIPVGQRIGRFVDWYHNN